MKDSTNTGTMPKIDQITMNSQPKYININTTGILNKYIEALVLKGNLLIMGRKINLLSATKEPAGLNTELKHCGCELCEHTNDLAA